MKTKEKKERKKGQETTIGKIIYGFLLFMPLFAIGVTCGYVMFNKNAYQSYSGSETQETTYIRSNSSFVVNKTYTFNNRNFSTLANIVGTVSSSAKLSFDNVRNLSTSISNIDFSDISSISFYKSSDSVIICYLYNSLGSQVTYVSSQANFIVFSFDFLSSELNNSLLENTNLFYYIDNFDGNYIDNVFYYSVDKVKQSPLFNWAQNSIVYTTINNTCTQLHITNTFIPLLMSYWLVISIIYFLYDIALMLVWIIHRKIHELQESI